MTTLRTAAQLALEALEYHVEQTRPIDKTGEAITALRAALEQPEQEPVADAMKIVIKAMQADPDYAWSWHCNVAMAFVDAGGDSYTANQGAARFMRLLANVEPAHKLPSHPPRREWRGLTEEEIDAVWEDAQVFNTHYDIARAIEQALKERNHE
jgi:hypothetical protein